MNRRTQLEIALVAASALALLWLYRSYLERSLAIQEQALADVAAERERDRTAAGKVGLVDLDALRKWADNGTPAPAPEVPAEPPAGEP